jgi:hypothetical protein
MTWPYAGVEVSGSHTTTYSAKTLTVIDAPSGFNAHNLVRGNSIQVPRDFGHYLAVGVAGVSMTNTGTGRYLMGWRIGGVTLTDNIGEVHSASGLSVRVMCPIQRPVVSDDLLDIAAAGPTGTAAITGQAWVYFLPLA